MKNFPRILAPQKLPPKIPLRPALLHCQGQTGHQSHIDPLVFSRRFVPGDFPPPKKGWIGNGPVFFWFILYGKLSKSYEFISYMHVGYHMLFLRNPSADMRMYDVSEDTVIIFKFPPIWNSFSSSVQSLMRKRRWPATWIEFHPKSSRYQIVLIGGGATGCNTPTWSQQNAFYQNPS